MYYIHYTVLSTQCTFYKIEQIRLGQLLYMYTIYTRQYTIYIVPCTQITTGAVDKTTLMFERFIQLDKHVKIAINISITGALG